MTGVTVHVPGLLQRYSGEEREVQVRASTVGEALEALFLRWPELRTRVVDDGGRLHPYLLLSHEGAELTADGLLEQNLADGDVLELIGVASGG